MTMDPYDSDSSGFDDEGDFTETGVLLGYASKEVIDDNISHLGGWPVCEMTGLARMYSY
jgi:pre-rRNA-processing protein TSR4